MVIMYQRDSTEILEINSKPAFCQILGLSDRKIYVLQYLGCVCIAIYQHLVARTKLHFAIFSVMLRNQQTLAYWKKKTNKQTHTHTHPTHTYKNNFFFPVEVLHENL